MSFWISPVSCILLLSASNFSMKFPYLGSIVSKIWLFVLQLGYLFYIYCRLGYIISCFRTSVPLCPFLNYTCQLFNRFHCSSIPSVISGNRFGYYSYLHWSGQLCFQFSGVCFRHLIQLRSIRRFLSLHAIITLVHAIPMFPPSAWSCLSQYFPLGILALLPSQFRRRSQDCSVRCLRSCNKLRALLT